MVQNSNRDITENSFGDHKKFQKTMEERRIIRENLIMKIELTIKWNHEIAYRV